MTYCKAGDNLLLNDTAPQGKEDARWLISLKKKISFQEDPLVCPKFTNFAR
jgi:hypothetical protein